MLADARSAGTVGSQTRELAITPQELAEAKADLAAVKAALRKRAGGKDIASAGSSGETVSYAKATVAELRLMKSDLEFAISLAERCGGALHPDPSTEAGRAAIQQNADDTANVFLDEVTANRGLSREVVWSPQFGQGAVLIGQKAVDAGLADEVSTWDEIFEELADAA